MCCAGRGWGADAVRRMTAALILLGGLGALAACAATAPTASTPSPSDLAGVVGVVAIGHSGLTGAGSDSTGEAVPENSWATGTAPEVDSVYSRLVAVRPENAGQVANTAVGGTASDMLVSQAASALKTVPNPLLLIISTIDNDIQCDGTDAENVPAFGANLAEALELVTTASPETTILVVGQLGRPSMSFVQTVADKDPRVTSWWSGSGPCDLFNLEGDLVPGNFEGITAIIEGYEAEQMTVCAQFVQCHTDGGVRAAYVDALENFSNDWSHLNIQGQAAEAELIWPVVVSLLDL